MAVDRVCWVLAMPVQAQPLPGTGVTGLRNGVRVSEPGVAIALRERVALRRAGAASSLIERAPSLTPFGSVPSMSADKYGSAYLPFRPSNKEPSL